MAWTIAPAEAQSFVDAALSVVEAIEDAERPASYAIPKSMMTCGEAIEFLTLLVALIAEKYPFTVNEEKAAVDLMALYHENSH